MTDKGSRLNKRIWQLFGNAGFKTKPNWNNPDEEQITLSPGKKRTLDLLAEDSVIGARVIGWNKARGELKESITTHFHDYLELKRRTKADAVLFVTSELELQQEDRSYADSIGVTIWGQEEIAYYETLVDTIGEFAKYEIVHALGIKAKEERRLVNCLALRTRQPFPDSDTDLFLFTAHPDFLLKTCVVFRKASGQKESYQRVLQRKRLAKIRSFVAASDALLPPNIIVHLSPDVSWSSIPYPTRDKDNKPLNLSRPDDYELVVLSIPTAYASLEVLDGQHRLFAFTQTEAATRQQFNLVVVGIAQLPSKRCTETFVAINDNARRMDPNLVLYLKYDPDEALCQADPQLMAIKIAVQLNKTTPFKKKIRVLDVGNQKLTLKGFAGYDLKGLVSTRGALRKHYPHESKHYLQALRLYFGVLKNLFPNQWQDPETYIIFTNRGISAFLKLLKSILKNSQAPLTESTARHYLAPIRGEWSDKHWETEALTNSYVGSQGWKNFHRDLVGVIRKKYKDFRI
jgi:DGQHR domain-containing protein